VRGLRSACPASVADHRTVDSSKPVPTVFTEADWNEFSPYAKTFASPFVHVLIVLDLNRKQSAEEGNKQNPMEAYRASKTLAERAAWEFVETNKPSWDISTINPPLVFGPIIHQVGKSGSVAL
jgi:hypothetical protein